MSADLRVADKLKRFCVRGDSLCDQIARLSDPACCKHRLDACLDASVESRSRRIKTDFQYLVTREPGAAGAMNFVDGPASQHAHFSGANYFLGVARRYACGYGWVGAGG